MSQIETLARQAWQLKEQGHSIEDIADAMNRPTSTVERWVDQWSKMASQAPPWHDGLEYRTVMVLKRAGIDSRSALIAAWEDGHLQRRKGCGIGSVRHEEIRAWLEAPGVRVSQPPTKARIFDMAFEAEAALDRIRRRSGERSSQVINRLLIEADTAEKVR